MTRKLRNKNMNTKSRGTRRSLQVENLEAKRLLAADWQNPLNALDVDASGESGTVAVSPLDALLVINELNNPQVSNADHTLPPAEDDPAPPYVDVDGNGIVSPLDAILVVNELNAANESDGSLQSFAPASFIAGTQAALSHLEDGDEDDDTLVNSTTNHKQAKSDIATSDSEVLIVWESLLQDGSSWGIFAQRYSADGAQIGDEFQVNTTTRGPQMNPAVAMTDDGIAMVVWQDDWADSSGWGITGRAFAADNTPLTEELLINSTTRGNQSNPDIAEHDGTFTVVWEGRGAGDNNGIFSSTVTTDSLIPTSEVLVNNYTSGNQSHPAVDASDAGVVIAWDGKGSGDGLGVFMSQDGGDQIRINSDSSGAQKHPTISISDSGQIATAWQQTPASRGTGVWARIFTPDSEGGLDASSTIQVNETTRGAQRGPSIDHLADGGIVASWYGRGDGDNNGIFSRVFDSMGVATTGETQMNHTTRAGQMRPAVVAVNDGYVTTWQGRGTGDRRGVFARFANSELSSPFRVNDIDDATINEGDLFAVTAAVTDLNGATDSPTFSLSSGPEDMTIDPATGEISWQSDEADGPGSFEVIVAATLGEFVDTEMFIVTVNEVNQNPTLEAIANMSAAPGEAFSFAPVGADADLPAQTLTYSATLADGSALPSWLAIDAATGVISGTPGETDTGGTIEVTVTDSEGGTASQQFDLTVSANNPPVVSNPIEIAMATDGAEFNLDVNGVFTDPDGDTLVISVTSGLPSWANFDANTGQLSGTPGNGDVGDAMVTMTADDQQGGTADHTFTIRVADTNTFAPNLTDQVFRISSAAADGASVGTLTATDPDSADTISYSITGGDGAALFNMDSATGEITVADSTGLTDPGTFTLDVQASDGTNMTSAVATVYTASTPSTVGYSLQAVDDDGNMLTSVLPGQTFNLVLSVQDIRATDPTGVFSAFADIVYQADLVSVAGTIVHSATYPSGTSGDTAVAGLIDEAGGVDGLSELGGELIEVLRVPLTVSTDLVDGTSIFFATNEADNMTTHPTLRFRDTVELPATEIDFGTLSLTVGAQATAALSFGTGGSQLPQAISLGIIADVASNSQSNDVVPTPAWTQNASSQAALIDDIFAADDQDEANDAWHTDLLANHL